jgi:hypothetical protein
MSMITVSHLCFLVLLLTTLQTRSALLLESKDKYNSMAGNKTATFFRVSA